MRQNIISLVSASVCFLCSTSSWAKGQAEAFANVPVAQESPQLEPRDLFLEKRRNPDEVDLRRVFGGYIACVEQAERHRSKVDVEALTKCTVDFVSEDPCVIDGFAAKGCHWGRFGPSSAKVIRRSENEYDKSASVLVIDEFEPSPALVRHQKQIFDVYSADAVIDHDEPLNNRFRGFEPMDLDIHLPIRLGGILETFSDLRGNPDNDELTRLLRPLLDAYGEAIPKSMGHGNAVLNILLGIVREKSVVVLDSRSINIAMMYRNLLCKIDNHQVESRLREIARAIATGISGLMRRHSVRYVNASFGVTSESIRAAWSASCPNDPELTDGQLEKIFDVYHPILQAIFDSSETIAFQAANERAWREFDAPFDVDREDFSSRIRVGVFSGYDSVIRDLKGSHHKPPGTQSPSRSSWSDVYIESGCDWFDCREAKPLSMSHGIGIGRFRFPAPATSFVTPVALAEGAHLDWMFQRLNRESVAHSRVSVISKMKDRPYRDPLWHWFYLED